MRLRLNPWGFLARLLVFFALTYVLWQLLAPAYTQLLLHASRIAIWLTEISSDPGWSHGTTLVSRGTAIFYSHRNFAALNLPPQGIPAEWVMANLVLLVPLMLATPAPTWKARFGRLGLALAIALVLQVADILVGIKSFYANVFRGYWSPAAAKTYLFLDAFFQAWDTQLFPFAIWAGIHFRQILGRFRPEAEAEAARPASQRPARAQRRRERRRGRG